VTIAKHAEKRIRQRVGIPLKAVARWVQLATSRGDACRYGSPLDKWARGKVYGQGAVKALRYRNYLLIHARGLLLTVYPCPGHLVERFA